MAVRRVRDPNKGSEYGGTDGLVQPPPHEPTAREQLIAIHQRQVLATGDFTAINNMDDDLMTASTDQYKGEGINTE
jgi:hypothetical protein